MAKNIFTTVVPIEVGMKINSIKNINYPRINSFDLNKNYSSKTRYFKDIYFGNNIKYSQEFLDITKDDKNIREYVASALLNDNDGEVGEKIQEDFAYLFSQLYKTEKYDKRTLLYAISAAFIKNYQKSGNIDYEKLGNDINQAYFLYEANYDSSQVRTILDYGDENMANAFCYMRKKYGDDLSFIDIKIFLTRYCTNEENQVDLKRVACLSEAFSKVGIQDKILADGLFTVMHNSDYEFDFEICNYINNSMDKLLSYIKNYDQNAIAYFAYNPKEASERLVFMFMHLVEGSGRLSNGEFSTQKANEAFDDWFEYVKENKETIEYDEKLRIALNNGKIAEKSIWEMMKKLPQQAYMFDNIIFLMSCVLMNERGTFS